MSEDVAGSTFVPGYAGHADTVARWSSDAQVRAWVGEALVDLADRLDLGGVRERVDALLMRCEFADQLVIRAIEDDRFGEPDLAALLESYDRKLIDAAKAATTTTIESLTGAIESIERAFDERAAAIAEGLKR